MNKRRIISKIRNILRPLKWFYPGMRVKRWLFLSFIGVIFIVAGGQYFSGPTVIFQVIGISFIFLGIGIILLGMLKMVASL